jgi:hypothetical protein
MILAVPELLAYRSEVPIEVCRERLDRHTIAALGFLPLSKPSPSLAKVVDL